MNQRILVFALLVFSSLSFAVNKRFVKDFMLASHAIEHNQLLLMAQTDAVESTFDGYYIPLKIPRLGKIYSRLEKIKQRENQASSSLDKLLEQLVQKNRPLTIQWMFEAGISPYRTLQKQQIDLLSLAIIAGNERTMLMMFNNYFSSEQILASLKQVADKGATFNPLCAQLALERMQPADIIHALHYARYLAKYEELAQIIEPLLLEQDIPNKRGETALLAAIKQKDTCRVLNLLKVEMPDGKRICRDSYVVRNGKKYRILDVALKLEKTHEARALVEQGAQCDYLSPTTKILLLKKNYDPVLREMMQKDKHFIHKPIQEEKDESLFDRAVRKRKKDALRIMVDSVDSNENIQTQVNQ